MSLLFLGFMRCKFYFVSMSFPCALLEYPKYDKLFNCLSSFPFKVMYDAFKEEVHWEYNKIHKYLNETFPTKNK